MADTSKNKLVAKSRREIAYHKQRNKNLLLTDLAAFFAEEAERRGITKKDLADVLGKDPAQITRWLSAPTNFETDTLTEILLALDAEMERRIVRFSEKMPQNYVHPLVASVTSQPQTEQDSVQHALKLKPAVGSAVSGTTVSIRAE